MSIRACAIFNIIQLIKQLQRKVSFVLLIQSTKRFFALHHQVKPTDSSLDERYFDLMLPQKGDIRSRVQQQAHAGVLRRPLNTHNNVDLLDCLRRCITDKSAQSIGYNSSAQQCLCGGVTTEIELDDSLTHSDAMLFNIAPRLSSSHFAYNIYLGFSIDANTTQQHEIALTESTGELNTLLDTCIRRCNKCTVISVVTADNLATCLGVHNANEASIATNVNTRLLLRISQSSPTLEQLNRQSLAQADTIDKCLTERTNKQSASTLIPLRSSASSPRRVRRGFSDFAGKAYDWVKHTATDTVVDVVTAPVKTVSKLIEGDFSGALDAAKDIPVVSDGVDIVKDVATYDIDTVLDHGLEPVTDALDAVVSSDDKVVGEAADESLDKVINKIHKRCAFFCIR